MSNSQVEAIISAVADWAIKRHDIRAMALVGSWARGNPHRASDVDLLILTDQAEAYRRSRKWLIEIDFASAGYRVQSSEIEVYGAVWSRHIRLLPSADVELTFAVCTWATIDPLDIGTEMVVRDAFHIVFDKDENLTKLTHAVMK